MAGMPERPSSSESSAAIGGNLSIPTKSVYRAIGWLARESKVASVRTAKSDRVELSEKA